MRSSITRTILPLCCGISIAVSAQITTGKFPFNDYNLPIEERVNDLVNRLTLEEKVAQMLNAAPAITRLGVPAYDWWNEVLHGVARTPFKVTVYPQAIAMAATFDTNSMYRMADYSALEGRAIHNKAIEQNRTNERYLGLTYWTPNINIFRDPRWGRGQETYGEDPFLTSMLAKSFVRGLQGDDPKYLKAAACAKHFAVHSGPEPTRHQDNVDPSNYDLWDTYLPAFRELVVNAHVAGVMCAYNAFRTQPCCASDPLMNDILRKQWNFTGYVTSDCWAVDDFFRYHKTHKDATSAAVDAVMHGTDVECGVEVYKTLVNAVKTKQITEEQLNISLRRLFTIRFRLGMFDPPSMVKYAQTPSSVLESAGHKAHALKMARQSIVLLKNAMMPGKTTPVLPLSKSLKKIVVIGPNADNAIAVLGNYNGTPSEIVTALQGIRSKVSKNTVIQYEKAINFTNDTMLVYQNVQSRYSNNGKPGFTAEYFDNKDLKGNPVVTRQEKDLDHFWQEGETINTALKANNFSARYTTTFSPVKDGELSFELEADDGYRLLVNGQEQLNAWTRNRWGARIFKLNAKKDSTYKIVIEYWQGDGKGNIRLRAGNFERTDFHALAQRTKDADVIVFIGGISPQLEGEEMKVDYPGFNGGDRTSILLPAVQTELLKALQKTGKPVVFVMMTGSAIALPWEADNIPAILNAWYGGQSAGTAIADVLFGDYNPAGRLPVTFYRSDNDLPAFGDYSMANRTYRYFKGQALFPFGYGLSYTNFLYKNASIGNADANGTRIATMQITNTGKMDGEEVVQVYISGSNGGKAPIRSLRGFQRIQLKAGETKTVKIPLAANAFMVINEEGMSVPMKGAVSYYIGGGQPGQTLKTSGNIVSGSIQLK